MSRNLIETGFSFQSLKLQSEQLKGISEFENELVHAREESLLTHAIRQSRFYSSVNPMNRPGASQTSITKPIKGILKKGKSYLRSAAS